jgi:hypothetical protein
MPDPLRHPLVARALAVRARNRLGSGVRLLLVEHESHTDLDRTVAVAIDVPPGAAPLDRLICTLGALEHELLHLRYTDRAAWQTPCSPLERLLREVLEDGRIERRGRRDDPRVAAALTAAEQVAPRLRFDRPLEPAGALARDLLAFGLGILHGPLGEEGTIALGGTTADVCAAAHAIAIASGLDPLTAVAPPTRAAVPEPIARGVHDPVVLADARRLLARVEHARENQVEGGRQALDGWQAERGERILATDDLRRRAPAVPDAPVGAAADACAEELRRVLRRRDETRRHLRHGHLDPGSLAGVLTGRGTIYQQPSRQTRRSVAMLVLADLSASTVDVRPTMRDALHLFRLACTGVGAALAINGFAGTDAVEHHELLSFAEADRLGRGAIDAVLDPTLGGGTTPAAEAADLARRLLVDREESDRVLVVLTDGEPNGGALPLRAIIDDARQDGVVPFGCFFGRDRRTRDALGAIFDEDFAVLEDLRDAAPQVFGRIATRLAEP